MSQQPHEQQQEQQPSQQPQQQEQQQQDSWSLSAPSVYATRASVHVVPAAAATRGYCLQQGGRGLVCEKQRRACWEASACRRGELEGGPKQGHQLRRVVC